MMVVVAYVCHERRLYHSTVALLSMTSSNEVCHVSTHDALPIAVSSVRAGKQVKSFLYAQSGSDTDRENILSLEISYFQFSKNSATKQGTMYGFFC
jgi:hypothetical protein